MLGTSPSALQCLPCPAGWYSNTSRAVSCNKCSANSFSTGVATSCTPCPSQQYSLPGSEKCQPQAACTTDDFVDLYTPCTLLQEVASRVHYLAPLDPFVCRLTGSITKNGVSTTRNATSSCAPCTDNQYRPQNSASCMSCPGQGTYVNTDGTCTSAVRGSAVIRSTTYFSDNSLNTWPTGFSTWCTGSCGSKGWRIKGNFIDSGRCGQAANLC